jgi:transposase
MTSSSRYEVFTDEQWARVEPLLPSNAGRRGHPFGDHRRVVEELNTRPRKTLGWATPAALFATLAAT